MHLERVLSYTDVANQEGGKTLTGGKQPDDPALKDGYFLEPTVVEAAASHRISKKRSLGLS